MFTYTTIQGYNETLFLPLYHPEIVNKEHTIYKNPNRTIFVTVGTGGTELHNFTGTVPHVVEQSVSHGFLNVVSLVLPRNQNQ